MPPRWWLAASLVLSTAVSAGAQPTQFWPEIDAYLRLNPNTRIFVESSFVLDAGSTTEADFGINLDVHLKPLRRRPELLFRLDESKNRALVVRGGYRYVHSIGAPDEHRAVVSATARYPLKGLFGDVLVSNRSLLDFRDIGGTYSWRYRNRLTFERELSARSMRLNPYLHVEAYYDSRYDHWNRTYIQLGASSPIDEHVEVEAYVASQNDRGKPQTRAAALVCTLYF